MLALALGQAGGRCDLSIERVAINVDDARIADNADAQPIDQLARTWALPMKAGDEHLGFVSELHCYDRRIAHDYRTPMGAARDYLPVWATLCVCNGTVPRKALGS